MKKAGLNESKTGLFVPVNQFFLNARVESERLALGADFAALLFFSDLWLRRVLLAPVFASGKFVKLCIEVANESGAC